MPVWRSLLLLFLLASGWAIAGSENVVSTPGKMYLQGKIIEAACYVDPRDQYLLVEFNDLSAREISGTSEKVSAHDFSIHLLGCALGDSQHPGSVFHNATITFSGVPEHGNNNFLSVQPADENLAIEIFDRYGNPIKLGTPSPDYLLNPGKNTLYFTAYLISEDGRIKSGEFNAAMHFVVNYL